ncbi:hypothetical protein ACGFYY_23275 [Streptomyces sp. NPDC048331]|uniref:hypothetical protein n=1 Tax=Streptomyces sp. NPDC048331 TaxID=3365534 RepID=UPI0037133331
MTVSVSDAVVSDVGARRFTRFWTAQTVSQVGQRFGMVALPVVAIETLHAVAAILAGWLGSHIGIVPSLWIGVAGACLTALPIIGMDRLIRG